MMSYLSRILMLFLFLPQHIFAPTIPFVLFRGSTFIVRMMTDVAQGQR
jgi:hypothetical protein